MYNVYNAHALCGYVHTIRSGLFTRETQRITHASLLTMPHGAEHCKMPKTTPSAHGGVSLSTSSCAAGEPPVRYIRYADRVYHPESANRRFTPHLAVSSTRGTRTKSSLRARSRTRFAVRRRKRGVKAVSGNKKNNSRKISVTHTTL